MSEKCYRVKTANDTFDILQNKNKFFNLLINELKNVHHFTE